MSLPNTQASSSQGPNQSTSVVERITDFAKENFILTLLALFIAAVALAYGLRNNDQKNVETALATEQDANKQLRQQYTELSTKFESFVSGSKLIQNENARIKERLKKLYEDSINKQQAIADLSDKQENAQVHESNAVNAAVGWERKRSVDHMNQMREEMEQQVALIQNEMNKQLSVVRDSLHHSESERQIAFARALEAENLAAQYKTANQQSAQGQVELRKGQELQRYALRHTRGLFGKYVLSTGERRRELGKALAAFRQAEAFGSLSPGYCNKLALDFETFL